MCARSYCEWQLCVYMSLLLHYYFFNPALSVLNFEYCQDAYVMSVNVFLEDSSHKKYLFPSSHYHNCVYYADITIAWGISYDLGKDHHTKIIKTVSSY